jgi:hypothetical protein
MTEYRLLVRPEVKLQLATLKRAAETQKPGGLRDREYQALTLGLRALVNGREDHFNGKRLGYSVHDLSDCAEIKLGVISETRRNHELGPSHRLIYREFEAEDGGPPYREVIAFEPRKDDRPFEVAAARLGREAGVRSEAVRAATRIALGTVRQSGASAPIRQLLPPDLRDALAAAADVAPARNAVTVRPSRLNSSAAPPKNGPPGRGL